VLTGWAISFTLDFHKWRQQNLFSSGVQAVPSFLPQYGCDAKLSLMQNTNTHLLAIPPPASRRIALRVTSTAERAVRQGHPWLYEGAITRQSHEGRPGDLAVIFDSQRNFLAIGLYDPLSTIRVRILQHHKPARIDQEWFTGKVNAATKVRANLLPNTTGYRLLHGENDGLPGLVIDRYTQSLVMKLYTLAWIPYLPLLLPILQNALQPQNIILRLGRVMLRYHEYLHQLQDGDLIYGNPPDGPVLFSENGITFEADLIYGQKTGFFLDQRDNRARVEKISQGKRVLNVFSYTGGFSVYAARGGAREVFSVDLSNPALEAARRNFVHNQQDLNIAACHHETQAGDALKLIHGYAQAKQRFDIVIIDPPAFAKRETEIAKAISAYQQLTRLGIAVLAPDGILVQASCSSRVDATAFFQAIHQAARQTGCLLKEIERTGHALDHPITFPEGAYLKCLFATRATVLSV
jgi:23S rRNA (cytosine1962-C5)-methyltransferase